jgi:putative transposase
MDWRRAIDGIIFRLRSGCQWNKPPERFGSDRSIHRWFQRWCRNGVFQRIWAVLVAECDALGRWIGSGSRPTGCWARPASGGEKAGPNPTDRGKKGTKKSLLVEADGGPLGAAIGGANLNDHRLLGATIEAVVVPRPAPEEAEQHLCLDAGYDNAPAREVARRHGYLAHIRPAGEGPRPPRRPGRRKARRVVERTLAWLPKCRALLVRYDKHAVNFLGLIQRACGLLWYRRLHRLNAA